MTTVPAATQSLIRHYLDQMASGLKGIDDNQRRDILAEMNSHLGERIAELESAGDARAMEHALASLGNPTQLAAQFVAEARTRFGSSRAILGKRACLNLLPPTIIQVAMH